MFQRASIVSTSVQWDQRITMPVCLTSSPAENDSIKTHDVNSARHAKTPSAASFSGLPITFGGCPLALP